MTTASNLLTAAQMVFAHDGGWDEILLVAIPLVLIAGVLIVADRRARERARDRDSD